MDIVGTAVGSILAVTILGYWVTSGSSESEEIKTAEKAVEVAQDAATKAAAAAEVKPVLAPVAEQVQAKADEVKAVVEEVKAEVKAEELTPEQKQAKEAEVAATAAAAAAAAVVPAAAATEAANTEAPSVTPEEAQKVASEAAAGTGLLTEEQLAANNAIPSAPAVSTASSSAPSTPGSEFSTSATSDPGSLGSRPSNIRIPMDPDAVDGTTRRLPRPDLGEVVAQPTAVTIPPTPTLVESEVDPQIILDQETSTGIRLSSEEEVQREVAKYLTSQGFVSEDGGMVYNHPVTKANALVTVNAQNERELHVLVSSDPAQKQTQVVPIIHGLMQAITNIGFATPTNSGAGRRRRRVTRNRRRRTPRRHRQITVEDLLRLLKK